MIKFDRLKIVSTIESISRIDKGKFQEKYMNGILYSLKFQQAYPYKLSIELNFNSGEAIIEFTGKILGNRYPELISVDTINDCFQRINEMGICSIDIDAMIDADVVSCDITQDVLLPNYLETMKMINGNIKNHQAYICRCYRTGSLSIEKNVVTSKHKKRLSIYNKEKEMNIAKNKNFVSANALSGKFEGKCRFELNLKCMEQIRDTLNIKDAKLQNVLASTANPIKDFVDEVLVADPEIKVSDKGWKGYWQSLVLKDCDNDLAKVEAKLRQYKDSRSCNISKYMEPFRILVSSNKEVTSTSSKTELLRLLDMSH